MKRKIIREVLLIVGLAILLGFVFTFITKQGFFSSKSSSNSSVKNSLEIIPLQKAKELFESKEALFIDSRHEFEYKLGHIEGAINIALNELESKSTRLDSIPKNKLIIIYCDGADCNSSVELGVKCLESGFTNIKIFFGGWQEWKNANFPIVK
jgi:rhodanese-related sulfurtransferase